MTQEQRNGRDAYNEAQEKGVELSYPPGMALSQDFESLTNPESLGTLGFYGGFIK